METIALLCLVVLCKVLCRKASISCEIHWTLLLDSWHYCSFASFAPGSQDLDDNLFANRDVLCGRPFWRASYEP